MRRRMLSALCAMCIAMAAHAALYQVDATETRANFQTRFLGIIPVRGMFKQTSGQLDYDPLTRQGTLHAVIHLATLQTAMNDDGMTDKMLKGPEFFDVEHFPLIEFTSSKFRWENDKLVAIEGTLTVRGISKPATLSIAQSRCLASSAEAKARCEATAQLSIQRSEFGINGWAATVSNTVNISIEFVAISDAPAPGSLPALPASGSQTPAPTPVTPGR